MSDEFSYEYEPYDYENYEYDPSDSDPDDWEYPIGWEDTGEQAAPRFISGGCLPMTILPPLAVLFISVVLLFGLGNLSFSSAASRPADEADEGTSAALAEAGAEETGLAPLFTAEVQSWAPQILEWASSWFLDPNLIATLMQIESCGDPQAVSSSGAMGLFQVMPFHFTAGEDGYDPQTNAQRGLAYLQSALEARGGEIRLALAGYNAGINGAKRAENLWPAETVRYVYWGMGIYSDAHQGKSQSQYLDEWLARGGASLCAQAGRRLGLNP